MVCADGGATRVDPPAGLEAVLVVPARGAAHGAGAGDAAAAVPMPDAVFNVGRASLLVLGLARGDLDLVARGLDDRLHQPRRAPLYPRSMELVERARSLGALGRDDLRRRAVRAGVGAVRRRGRRRGAAGGRDRRLGSGAAARRLRLVAPW